MDQFLSIAPDVKLGEGVRLSKFINLYGCEIGDETKIGAFVEIQKNASIGKRCKISSHTFICEGVTSLDWLRRDHPRQYLHWRECHCGSGRRGHQRCSGQHHCGRQSSQNSASN